MVFSGYTQIAKFMGPTWGPPGSCRTQMGPMLASWTLLSGHLLCEVTQMRPVRCCLQVSFMRLLDHLALHHCCTYQYYHVYIGMVGAALIPPGHLLQYPDSKTHGANMGPTWGWQDPGGPHVGPMNLTIWVAIQMYPHGTRWDCLYFGAKSFE